jgi:integrase
MATNSKRRGRGEGSIYRDGSGWKGQIDLGWVDGKRRRPVVRGATKREVSEALAELRRRAGIGQLAPGRAPTVEQAVEAWLSGAEGRLAPKTVESYRWVAEKYVIPSLGARKRADRVTVQDVRALTKGLRERGLSKRTQQYAQAVARMALGDAVKLGQLGANVATMTAAPRPKKTAAGALTGAEAKKLLAAAQQPPDSPLKADRRALWVVALTTGCRQGELLGLRWRHVDLEAGHLFVAEGKSDSSRRYVPLLPVAVEALGEAGPPDAYVFASRNGTPLQARNVVRDWHAFCEATLGRRARFHDLRHTAATLWLEAGVDIKVVAALLGHASHSITGDIYTEVRDALKADAAARLAGLLGAP